MDNIRKLQLVELDILKQILEICQKHNLTYYMLGGTLLGAVRHQGFIPWDDDIDLGIPRPDYERFIQFANTELSPPFQVHTLQNQNGEYSYYYARIENTDVRVIRSSSLRKTTIPVWIDVFPLDGVPNSGKKKEKWIRKCYFYRLLFDASQYSYFGRPIETKKKRPPLKKIARHLFISFKLENVISTKWAWEKLDKALQENDYDRCDCIINFCGYWGIKEMFPKFVYGKGRHYQFEDISLNGPEDYDTVLTQMYGDYMTPPPEDQREHHYIEFV